MLPCFPTSLLCGLFSEHSSPWSGDWEDVLPCIPGTPKAGVRERLCLHKEQGLPVALQTGQCH